MTAAQPIPSGLDWAAVVMGANASARVAALRAAGVREIYIWDHPRSWRLDTWREGLSRMVGFAQRERLTGIIADAEGGWETATGDDARAFGAALDAASREFDVGFTSYPGFRLLRSIASAAPRVWGLVQIYNRGSRSAEVFASWFATFRSAFPSTIIIAATFVPATDIGQDLATREGYRAYLGRLPRSYGLATYGVGPSYMQAEVAAYRPLESSPLVAPLLSFATGFLPGGMPLPVVITLVVFALIIAAWGVWSVVRRVT